MGQEALREGSVDLVGTERKLYSVLNWVSEWTDFDGTEAYEAFMIPTAATNTTHFTAHESWPLRSGCTKTEVKPGRGQVD